MNTTIVVIPESVDIGYVIGSGGRTIRSIEEETKTRIRCPPKSNPADRKFTHNILDDDFVEILRWLCRSDLDGVQITSRKLRRLTEDNQMPRRLLHASLNQDDNLHIGTPFQRPGIWACHAMRYHADMGRAAAYFSYAFVATFEISCYTTDDDVLPILPRRELLTAPDELIKEIRICGIHVNFRQAGALEEAICVCRFDQFSVNCHRMPDWLISDDFLRRLGRAGCAKVDLSKLLLGPPNRGNFALTDNGILDYCFSSDLGALGSRERTLWIQTGVSIGPTFFRKCIEAHVESRVTTKMELELHKGGTARYDVSGFLEHMEEYAAYRVDVSEDEIRYDIPDLGDGMRLLIVLYKHDYVPFHHSRLLVRRAQKNDEEFFLRSFPFWTL